jgi:hypothetical protein
VFPHGGEARTPFSFLKGARVINEDKDNEEGRSNGPEREAGTRKVRELLHRLVRLVAAEIVQRLNRGKGDRDAGPQGRPRA